MEFIHCIDNALYTIQFTSIQLRVAIFHAWFNKWNQIKSALISLNDLFNFFYKESSLIWSQHLVNIASTQFCALPYLDKHWDVSRICLLTIRLLRQCPAAGLGVYPGGRVHFVLVERATETANKCTYTCRRTMKRAFAVPVSVFANPMGPEKKSGCLSLIIHHRVREGKKRKLASPLVSSLG